MEKASERESASRMRRPERRRRGRGAHLVVVGMMWVSREETGFAEGLFGGGRGFSGSGCGRGHAFRGTSRRSGSRDRSLVLVFRRWMPGTCEVWWLSGLWVRSRCLGTVGTRWWEWRILFAGCLGRHTVEPWLGRVGAEIVVGGRDQKILQGLDHI